MATGNSPTSRLHPRRIVVRGTNWLGDAVMTTPALLRLREKFPESHIALLTPEKLQDLWQHHPAIDEIISIESDESVFSVGNRLRELGFDAALVLPNSPRSALEAWLARIPERIGYGRPWRNYFLTRVLATRPESIPMRKRSVAEIRRLTGFAPISREPKSKLEPDRTPVLLSHQINEYLHLAAALGANPEPLPPQLFVIPDELDTTKTKFGLNKVGGPLFGLNPGAEYGPAKRWPVEKFIAAALDIQQRTKCTWVLFGGKNDIPLAGQVSAALRAARLMPYDLSGKTSLRELMALLRICRVLLTNDTGPAHVAAALGTAVVAPFGSTSPELTGPGLPGDPRHWLLKSEVPCSPCFLRECPIDFRCMNGISVERVVDAALASANPVN